MSLVRESCRLLPLQVLILFFHELATMAIRFLLVSMRKIRAACPR